MHGFGLTSGESAILANPQSCDDEFDHATCVVAGVVVRADTEIADATQQFVGIRVGENLARCGSGVEQLGAHGQEAVEEIGVQSLEGGIVGLQRRGEAVLGDQEVDEEVDPPCQGGVRCAAVRQQCRTSLSACLDLVSAMSRTGTSTPEAMNAAAAASRSVSSLRRASARFRGADDPDPLSMPATAPLPPSPLGKRNRVPYVG